MTLAFFNPSAPSHTYTLPPIHVFDLREPLSPLPPSPLSLTLYSPPLSNPVVFKAAPPPSIHHHHHQHSSHPCSGRSWAPPTPEPDHILPPDVVEELSSPSSSSSSVGAFSSKHTIPSVARSVAAVAARSPSCSSSSRWYHSTTSHTTCSYSTPSSSSYRPMPTATVAQPTMATFAPHPQSSSSQYPALSSSTSSLHPFPAQRRSPHSRSRQTLYADSSRSSSSLTGKPSGSSNGVVATKPAMLPPLHIDTTFVPQNTGDMICYLWFATNLTPPRATTTTNAPSTSTSSTSPRSSSTARRNRSPSTSSFVSGTKLNGSSATVNTPASAAAEAHRLQLQFSPSPAFITFLSTLLRTTQVSQGVIILSLHYIYRLKLKNSHIRGLEGSEFRLAVIALMLANKFLDE
jgi:hypothetical protein